MKINHLLTGTFLIILLISITVIGSLSFNNSKKSLEESAFNQLTAIRETKKENIESYFDQIRNQILTFSEDKMIIDAMKEFKEVFHEIKEESEILDEQINEYAESNRNYYQDEYLTRLNPNVDRKRNIDEYWADDKETIILQYHYITNNLNPTGLKDNLNIAYDKSS